METTEKRQSFVNGRRLKRPLQNDYEPSGPIAINGDISQGVDTIVVRLTTSSNERADPFSATDPATGHIVNNLTQDQRLEAHNRLNIKLPPDLQKHQEMRLSQERTWKKKKR